MSNQRAQPENSGGETVEHRVAPPLDYQQLLKRCLGNLALADRVLSSFERRFEGDLSQLHQGLQANNTQVVARVAHQLKGASANLAAAGLQRITGEIEELARADGLAEAEALLGELRGEWQRFIDFRTSTHESVSAK